MLVAGISIKNPQDLTTSGAIYTWPIGELDQYSVLLSDPDGEINNILFSPDGDYLVYTVIKSPPPTPLSDLLTPSNIKPYYSTMTGYLKLFAIQTKQSALIGTNESAIRALAISANSEMIATVSQDRSLKIWNRQSKSLQSIIPNGDISALAFSPDNKTLATGSISSGNVQLWNTKTGKLVAIQQDAGVTFSVPVRKISFSPDGQLLAIATEDGRVRFWNIQ